MFPAIHVDDFLDATQENTYLFTVILGLDKLGLISLIIWSGCHSGGNAIIRTIQPSRLSFFFPNRLFRYGIPNHDHFYFLHFPRISRWARDVGTVKNEIDVLHKSATDLILSIFLMGCGLVGFLEFSSYFEVNNIETISKKRFLAKILILDRLL